MTTKELHPSRQGGNPNIATITNCDTELNDTNDHVIPNLVFPSSLCNVFACGWICHSFSETSRPMAWARLSLFSPLLLHADPFCNAQVIRIPLQGCSNS